MLSKNIEKAFSDQINNEFFSAYLYLSMANYFESIDLKGFAHWMKIQSKEELSHGMKIFDYVMDRNGSVALLSIKNPKYRWTSATDAFQNAYEHEKEVTKSIHILYALTQKEKDLAASVFLNWFIEEQAEEEAASLVIVKKLKLIKNDLASLYLLDKELSERK